MKTLLTGTILLLAATTTSAAAGTTLRGRWWVVLGSFANPDTTRLQSEAVARVGKAARRCGFEPMSDFSAKFDGFAAGFDVVVVGGFTARAQADAAAARLRRCVPNAFVKQGTYAGE